MSQLLFHKKSLQTDYHDYKIYFKTAYISGIYYTCLSGSGDSLCQLIYVNINRSVIDRSKYTYLTPIIPEKDSKSAN